MANARRDKAWFRCPNCGRKLGRAIGQWDDLGTAFPAIETKCPSCKTIVYIMIGKDKVNHDSE